MALVRGGLISQREWDRTCSSDGQGWGHRGAENPSACGKVEMKPAVPNFSACGGDGWSGEQGQPGFLLRKKCHIMVRGEQAAGDVSHAGIACEVHLWMQEDENIIKTPHV